MNKQDPGMGWSALIWASKEGRVENVKILLEAGADPGLKDKMGKTALDWAKEKENQELVVLLRGSG